MKLSFKLSDCLEWEPADQDTLNYTAGRKEGDVLSFEVTNKKRTNKQSGCFHDYMGDLANALNNGGIDVVEVITWGMPFTKDIIKENMAKRIIKALYPEKIKIDKHGKEAVSTTQLSTKEIGVVYEYLNKWSAESHGISIPWPSRFNH